MNKTSSLIFFILLNIYNSAFADNWELFPFNQSSYYSDNGSTDFNHLYHYTQDSIRDDGGSKTFFFNRFPFSLNHDQCIYESCKLLGDSTEFDSLSNNSNFYYFIFGSDTAQFFPFSQQGDFWFISCPNGGQGFDSIKVTCTFNDLSTIVGQTDSVKRFLIEAWNNGSSVNYFNNYEFELSKTFGLTNWFSFQFLLRQSNLFDAIQYTLVGCELNGNKFGYTLPTFEDYFSCWQEGNIFKYEQTFKYDYNIWRDSVLQVQWYPDSIVAIVRERKQHFERYTDRLIGTVFFVDTIKFYKTDYQFLFSKTFTQISFKSSPVLNPRVNKIVYGNFLGVPAIGESYFFGTPPCVYSPIYGSPINSYAVGPGEILNYTPYPYSYNSGANMVGFTCNGNNYGDWNWYTPIDSTSVVIPNCFNYLISNITDNKLQTCLDFIPQFKIFDTGGRLLIAGKYYNSEIDVAELVAGIYILEIKYGNKFYLNKFFKY